MMRRIAWVRLDLEGFGIWRSPVRFRFPESFGVFHRPNEGGKSTAVAGLRAILFGLPGKNDPASHGLARYRSWGETTPCRGTLVLRVDDRTIRIRRDLTTHETSIDEIDDTGIARKPLFRGNANPDGRTPAKRDYEELLTSLIGDLADEDLFVATFFIEQPVLPPGKMSEALRKLVSGVGRVGGSSAQGHLFDEVKKLTRETGERGLTAPGTNRPTNQRTDGAIERKVVQLAELKARRASVASEYDRRNRLEDALAETIERQRAAAEEQRHLDTDLKQIEAYRQQLVERDTVRAARDDLERILKAHDESAEQAIQTRKRIDEEFPDLIDLPEGFEENLAQVTRLDAARVPLDQELDEQRRSISALEVRLEELRQHPVFGDLEPAREDPIGWLARARESTDRWQDAAHRFLTIEEDQKTARVACEALSAVAVLPSDVQDALARFPQSLGELRSRQSMATDLEASHRLRVEELERRRTEFTERYSGLEGLEPSHFLPVLEERVAQHRKILTIESNITQLLGQTGGGSGRNWKRGIPIGIVCGLAAGAVGLFGGLELPWSILLAALISIGAGLLVSSRPGAQRKMLQQIDESEQEVERIKARLQYQSIPPGPWLPDDEGLEERARSIFQRRDEETAAIASAEAELPSPDAIEETESARSTAAKEIERLETQAREIEEATGRPAQEAVEDYRDLSRRIEEIDSRRRNAWSTLVGANRVIEQDDPDSSHRLEVPIGILSDAWDLLPAVASLLSPPPETLGQLHDRLNSLSDEDWDRWEQQAREISEVEAAVRHATTELAKTETKRGEIVVEFQHAFREIGEARLAASDGSFETLRQRLRSHRDSLDRVEEAERSAMERLESARGGPFADRDALARELKDHDDRRRDAQVKLDRLLEGSDLVRHYAEQEPEAQDRFRRERDPRILESAETLRGVDKELADARAAIDAWKPSESISLAACDLEIAQHRQGLSILKERCDAYQMAWGLMGEAIRIFTASHRAEIEERLDRTFRTITGKENRSVRLDEDFGISLFEEGTTFGDDQLSLGARDQLAFCLRLAVADLVAGEMILPLILDDPFVHCDAERLERVRESLEAASKERQVLLLTQDERLNEWGQPIRTGSAMSDSVSSP